MKRRILLVYDNQRRLMTSKQLILLRHAKSDWESNALTDHDRPLSPRGRKDVPRMGRWLSESGYPPELVLCSSAIRTQETLMLVQKSANWGEIDTQFEKALYLASKSEIVGLITDNLTAYDRLLIVGHNPGLDSVLLTYCPHITRTHNNKLMTTAAIAIIEFTNAALSDPKLIEFVRPSDLISET